MTVPPSERTNLEVGLAVVGEKLDAIGKRIDRVEGVLVAIGLLVIGAGITALVRLL